MTAITIRDLVDSPAAKLAGKAVAALVIVVGAVWGASALWSDVTHKHAEVTRDIRAVERAVSGQSDAVRVLASDGAARERRLGAVEAKVDNLGETARRLERTAEDLGRTASDLREAVGRLEGRLLPPPSASIGREP